MLLSTVLIELHSEDPSDTFEYLFTNISALIEVKIKSSISLLVGQISFKKTSLPSLSLPRGDLYNQNASCQLKHKQQLMEEMLNS